MTAPATRLAAPESYTPKHLAEKILTSKSAMEGERKLVTVMFSDVSGFTAMSEKLDPEDVHSIMERVFEVIMSAVHRYEGNINQFLGDGVMALFGAPIAHEDHPHRALSAALAIQQELQPVAADVRRRTAWSSACEWGSIPVSSWSARSGKTSEWTTRRSGTPRTWLRGSWALPSRARSW